MGGSAGPGDPHPTSSSPAPHSLFDEEEDKGTKQRRAQPVNPLGYYQSHNRLRRAAGNWLSPGRGAQPAAPTGPAPTGCVSPTRRRNPPPRELPRAGDAGLAPHVPLLGVALLPAHRGRATALAAPRAAFGIATLPRASRGQKRFQQQVLPNPALPLVSWVIPTRRRGARSAGLGTSCAVWGHTERWGRTAPCEPAAQTRANPSRQCPALPPAAAAPPPHLPPLLPLSQPHGVSCGQTDASRCLRQHR